VSKQEGRKVGHVAEEFLRWLWMWGDADSTVCLMIALANRLPSADLVVVGDFLMEEGTRRARVVNGEKTNTYPKKPRRDTMCPYCEQEIDETTCWCGDAIAPNRPHDNHSPVPMGCVCRDTL
jgi:hypothetical protein